MKKSLTIKIDASTRTCFAAFLIFNLALLSACASIATNKSQSSSSLEIRNLSELATDIEVDVTKPVTGKAKHAVLFGFIDIERPEYYADGITYNSGPGFNLFGLGLVDGVKAAAAYKAVNNPRVEVLVMPQYTFKVVSRFMGMYKEVSATVTGYPGKVRRVRNVSKRPSKDSRED